MKHQKYLTALLAFLCMTHAGFSQTTAFTYQGLLEAGGAPATGSFDLEFSLFTTNSGGSQVAARSSGAASPNARRRRLTGPGNTRFKIKVQN